MAPAGPPSDPPDRPDDPREREVADWDWGGDWDAPARRGGRSGDRRDDDATDRDGPRRDDDGDAPHDAAPHPGVDAPGSSGRPPRTPLPPVVLRRRATAIGGAVVALLLVVLGATAIAGGGDDGDDAKTAARPDGGELRSLAGVAARASSDQLERAAAVAKYAKLGLPVYCGAGKKPWVALTFDDGPGPLSPKWIALMSKERIPMTLFRIGRNVPGNEEYVRVQRNLGWDSGSHTQNHPALATESAKDQRAEIEHGNEASHRALGRPPELFRPPYESHNAETDRIVKRAGMVQVLWNVDTQDSLGNTSVDQIVETAKKGMQAGSIILMHEVKENTLAAMPRIIAALRERHLTPVTVTRMLASDGPSEAQLRKGYDGCPVDLTPGKAAS
ncbi:polysaccharide deacetylase family protein [Patulibacter sp. NPDC049589]|uniref:polysaccharide deacetylase family protein n=1 Tax=Patulibacter sp. NPDC049589 TaxID=3154731 RepID=UPI003424A597